MFFNPWRCDSSPFTGLWCITMMRASPARELVEFGARALDLRACRCPMIERSRMFHVSVSSVTPCDVLSPTNVAPGDAQHRLQIGV